MGYTALHSCQWSGTSPNLPLLNEYDFFSDGGGGHFWWDAVAWDDDFWGSCHSLTYLYETFPEAKFFLNTRRLDEWLRSKMFHAG